MNAAALEHLMTSEIIVIGDEILLGQTADTNSAFIAQRLAQIGHPVTNVNVIGDNRETMRDAFRRAYHRSDLVLITGGLGPTHDDLTKETLAAFFNLPLVFRNDILDQVREIYRKRQLTFNRASREQAEFPEGATAIPNRFGTAPGIWIEHEGRIYAAMPGVPAEMKAMVTDFIVPRIQRKAAERPATCFLSLHTFGIKESDLYERIANRSEIEKHASLAFLPSYRGVRLRLTATARNAELAREKLASARDLLRPAIAPWLIGEGEDVSIEEVVGRLLADRGWKLVVAESCTAGLLGKRITDIAGSSAWFERGWMTYSNEAKHEELGVPAGLIEEHGAVSEEVARAMAEGALTHSRGQVALSITGVAGPDGGTEQKPVGLVYIGYADASTVTAKRYQFADDREVNRERSATAALLLLLDHLKPRAEASEPQLI